MVANDPLRALLGLLFMLTAGFMIIGRLWLFGRMKRYVPGLSLMLSTTFFYLEAKYWSNRDNLRGHGIGMIALSVFLSPLAFLAVCLALFMTRK